MSKNTQVELQNEMLIELVNLNGVKKHLEIESNLKLLVFRKDIIEEAYGPTIYKLTKHDQQVLVARSANEVITELWGTDAITTVYCNETKEKINLVAYGEIYYRLINPVRYLTTRGSNSSESKGEFKRTLQREMMDAFKLSVASVANIITKYNIEQIGAQIKKNMGDILSRQLTSYGVEYYDIKFIKFDKKLGGN